MGEKVILYVELEKLCIVFFTEIVFESHMPSVEFDHL